MENIHKVTSNESYGVEVSNLLILQNISVYWPNVKYLEVGNCKISSIDAFLIIPHLETLVVCFHTKFNFNNEAELEYPNIKQLKIRYGDRYEEFNYYNKFSNAFPNLEMLHFDDIWDVKYSRSVILLQKLKKLKDFKMRFVIPRDIQLNAEDTLLLQELCKSIAKFEIKMKFSDLSSARSFVSEVELYNDLWITSSVDRREVLLRKI
jgi:hypothetical protein